MISVIICPHKYQIIESHMYVEEWTNGYTHVVRGTCKLNIDFDIESILDPGKILQWHIRFYRGLYCYSTYMRWRY